MIETHRIHTEYTQNTHRIFTELQDKQRLGYLAAEEFLKFPVDI